MFGKKMNKIRCRKNKRARKLMINGRKNPNFRFLRLDRLKIKEKLELPGTIGFKEENSDMVGKIPSKLELEEALVSRTKRLKLFKKDLRLSSYKKLPREANQEDLVKELREVLKEDLKEALREVLKEDLEEVHKVEKEREDDIFNYILLRSLFTKN